MPDNPDLIELFEAEFDTIIYKAKRSGLTYAQILYCVLDRLATMVRVQCPAEAWLGERIIKAEVKSK